jgi:hypothetical protein
VSGLNASMKAVYEGANANKEMLLLLGMRRIDGPRAAEGVTIDRNSEIRVNGHLVASLEKTERAPPLLYLHITEKNSSAVKKFVEIYGLQNALVEALKDENDAYEQFIVRSNEILVEAEALNSRRKLIESLGPLNALVKHAHRKPVFC